MTCPRCQTINPEGAMTCASCGAPLVMGAPMGPAGAPQPQPMGGYPPPGMYPPAGYGPQGYGQPGYGQPYMMMAPQAPTVSGMAIAGFVLALLSCSLFGLIFSIIGLNQVNSSQGMKTGKGFAIAGIIISVAWFLIVIMAMAAGNHH